MRIDRRQTTAFGPLARLALAALVAMALVAVAPAAQAGPGPPFLITASKHKDGPYQFMALKATIKDSAKDFYFKVASKTDQKLDMRLVDESFGDGRSDFRIRWYRRDHNITQDAANDHGYLFGLKPGARKVFRSHVTPLVAHPGALCLSPTLTALPDVNTQVGAVYVNSTSVCG